MRIAAPLNHEPLPTLQWIEVATSFQIPSFQIIGLPSPEVAEAKDRVRAAIESTGLEFPKRRVVVNLSPAHVRKKGTGIDLAVALAVLHSKNEAEAGSPAQDLKVVAWGELGLDGKVKPAFHLTRALYAAYREKADLVFISRQEISLAQEILPRIAKASGTESHPRLIPVSDLGEAWAHLASYPALEIETRSAQPIEDAPPMGAVDPKQEYAEPYGLLPLPASLQRLLGVAASGHHHLMIMGPRGTGKSRALEWLSVLLPPPSPETGLEQEMLFEASGARYSLSGPTPPADSSFPVSRIRRVNPNCRPASLLGSIGPQGLRPGDFSLAHGGLLIADEFPEWPRDCREALREPLERGAVTLTRVVGHIELPARFVFAGTGNLCPCGGWPAQLPVPMEFQGTNLPRCRCSDLQRRAYLSRFSGPVMDRIDILVMMIHPAPAHGQELPSTRLSSLPLRERCFQTHEQLIHDWGKPSGLLDALELESLLRENPSWDLALRALNLSSLRSRHKILRIALTLSAWEKKAEPNPSHFTEASLYRPERFGLSD